MDTPIHYLRPMSKEFSPHRVLVFDTETRPTVTPLGEYHHLRLWRAELVIRHGRQGRQPELTRFGGHTAQQLVAVVDREASHADALWVYSHNLHFDLTVSELVPLLVDAGWGLTQHALAGESPWAKLRKGDHHITIADSASILPTSVAQIGRGVGIDKPPLPSNADPEEAWDERCAADVAAVRTALCQAMDWWDATGAGNWSLTGAGCGWNLMRHRHMRDMVLIDPDQEARDRERATVTGGRREVWRWGPQPPGVMADLDFHSAHATIMAHMPLPTRRLGDFAELPVTHRFLQGNALDVLAEVEIEARAPRYPLEVQRGVFYPVGRFRTTLCGPEIREARARGELISIGRGYVYQLSYHGRDFAQWLLGALDSDPPELPPSVAIAAKGWSRSVPGRWAARTGRVVDSRPDAREGWWYEEGVWGPDGVRCGLLTVGHLQQIIIQDVDGDDCFPAVLGWVQSWTRVMLSRLIDALGQAVVQCNTDGCIVDVMALWATLAGTTREEYSHRGDPQRFLREVLAAIGPEIAPLDVRIKKLSEKATIIGPQHVVMDSDVRLSGIPRGAVEVAPYKWAYEAWPRLSQQMQQGQFSGYRVESRTADLSRVPINRWRLKGGHTAPVRARIPPDGRSELVGIALGDPLFRRLAPADMQHPELRALMGKAWDVD